MMPPRPSRVLAFAAGIALASAGTVQAASFSDISDGDDEITLEEFQAYFGDKLGLAALKKYDADGDGIVTPAEVAQKSSEQGWENSTNGMHKAFENASAGRAKAEENRARAEEKRTEAKERGKSDEAPAGPPSDGGASASDRGGPPDDRGGPPEDKGRPAD